MMIGIVCQKEKSLLVYYAHKNILFRGYAMTGKIVAGRSFRTEGDYQAALRDQYRIDKIKEKTDMNDPEQVITCSVDIQSGRYHFETMVGNDFDDEMYGLATKYKKGELTGCNTPDKKRRHFLFDRKKKQGRTAAEYRNKSRDNGDINGLEDCDPAMQAEIIRQLKAQEKKRKTILIVCTLIAFGCFAYWGIYNIYAVKNGYDYSKLSQMRGTAPVGQNISAVGTDETDESVPPILDDYKNLYLRNKNIIGWLKIDDTNIDYPVMQTSDDIYYLTHDFDGNEDKNGCLFMDSKCNVINRSTNLIIYGHHMRSGKMFGTLVNYKDVKYFEKHPEISFDTIYEKGVYQIMYIFNAQVYSEGDVAFKYYQFIDPVSEKEFKSDMMEMQKMSLYSTGVTADYGDQLLTLSTCDRTEKNGRFVVVAKRTE